MLLLCPEVHPSQAHKNIKKTINLFIIIIVLYQTETGRYPTWKLPNFKVLDQLELKILLRVKRDFVTLSKQYSRRLHLSEVKESLALNALPSVDLLNVLLQYVYGSLRRPPCQANAFATL